MAEKLRVLFTKIPRGLEQADVFAVFLRVARARWGDYMPLEPIRFSHGTLTIRCPSPLWRVEVLFHANTEDFKKNLLHKLPKLSLQRVSGILT